MNSLSDFSITRYWPATRPDHVQLYSWPTPNGVKVSIMLEEAGIPYEAHAVDIGRDESHLPTFVEINPSAKIPVIIDPKGPEDEVIVLAESGAILLYLAEKSGKFLSSEPVRRWETIQWVFFQMAYLGPMFGQVGFFNKFAGKDWEDKRPLKRYVDQSRQVLSILDKRLTGRTWIMDDAYTVADISMLGWVNNLITFYEAGDLVEYSRYKQVDRWLRQGLAREAVQRGLAIPATA